jgi:hypothetical protein
VRTHAAELMHARESSDGCVIFNDDMTCQSCCVGQDDIISNLAVMSDVNVRHQKIVIADSGVSAATLRTSMNVDVFTKDIVITDREKRFFTLEFQVLWLQTDRSERKEVVVLTNYGRPLNDDVRIEAAPVSDFDAITYAAIRTDRNIGADFCLRTHNGSWVNHGC